MNGNLFVSRIVAYVQQGCGCKCSWNINNSFCFHIRQRSRTNVLCTKWDNLIAIVCKFQFVFRVFFQFRWKVFAVRVIMRIILFTFQELIENLWKFSFHCSHMAFQWRWSVCPAMLRRQRYGEYSIHHHSKFTWCATTTMWNWSLFSLKLHFTKIGNGQIAQLISIYYNIDISIILFSSNK